MACLVCSLSNSCVVILNNIQLLKCSSLLFWNENKILDDFFLYIFCNEHQINRGNVQFKQLYYGAVNVMTSDGC